MGRFQAVRDWRENGICGLEGFLEIKIIYEDSGAVSKPCYRIALPP